MTHLRKLISLGVALGAVSSTAQAQSMDWYTIDCGGGTSTAGPLSLSGTIGQHDAPLSGLLSGGGFTLASGFWSLYPVCIGDFNNSGSISPQDIFDFLAAYFSNCLNAGAPPCYNNADVNKSGAITVQDIFDFLASYFGGCS